jgi:hypothetical protein
MHGLPAKQEHAAPISTFRLNLVIDGDDVPKIEAHLDLFWEPSVSSDLLSALNIIAGCALITRSSRDV